MPILCEWPRMQGYHTVAATASIALLASSNLLNEVHPSSNSKCKALSLLSWLMAVDSIDDDEMRG
jgi:hypothetical protein